MNTIAWDVFKVGLFSGAIRIRSSRMYYKCLRNWLENFNFQNSHSPGMGFPLDATLYRRGIEVMQFQHIAPMLCIVCYGSSLAFACLSIRYEFFSFLGTRDVSVHQQQHQTMNRSLQEIKQQQTCLPIPIRHTNSSKCICVYCGYSIMAHRSHTF